MVDRVKAYKDAASDPRAAACGDAAILWAMMVNAVSIRPSSQTTTRKLNAEQNEAFRNS